MKTLSSHGEVHRVIHELKIRQLTVKAVQSLSPGFLSVTFTGAELDGFTSLSFDDHVKVMIEDSNGEMVRRDYTPRQYDAETQSLTIEFAVHEGGFASNWAQGAQIGDKVTIGGPRASLVIPTDYAWHLLIGDETALPAIHRRIEELADDAQIMVIAKIHDQEDIRQFPGKSNLSVVWVDSYESLMETVAETVLPQGEGYIWSAGEAAVMATIKRHLVEEKGVDRKKLSVASYWKQGESSFHERL